jgi:hypothetical protein
MLPLLRDRDLRTGPSWIQGLAFEPVSDGLTVTGYASRNRIRIYDGDNSGRLSVTVRLLGTGPRSAFVYGQYTVDVNRREYDDVTYPWFGELAIPDTCVRAPLCETAGFAVELTPNDPHSRYWAVGTNTNNSTTETLVVMPQ